MPSQKETIMVTGGAGFIGSHLVDKLLDLGYKIITVDNFIPTYSPGFKYENIATHLTHAGYELRKCNICSLSSLEKIFKERTVNRIIHLAGATGVRNSVVYPLRYQKVNIGGTYNLLFLAKKYKIKQFIFASSSSVYGNAKTPFSENLPVNSPLSPYAASKSAGELACYTFHNRYRLPTTVLRLFSVYGPRGRPDMAPYLFTEAVYHDKPINLYGDGSSSRDWTYIDDIVQGFMAALRHIRPFTIINLGNSTAVSLSNLIKTIEKKSGRRVIVNKLPANPEESHHTAADIKKVRAEFGWQPKISLEQGIAHFINWYQKKRLEVFKHRYQTAS